MSNELSIGDYVTIDIAEKDILVQMQQNHGGWGDHMAECIGKKCKLVRKTGSDAIIKGPSGLTYRVNSQLLSNYEAESKQTWKVGDEGILLKDMNRVMELQENHGGWVDSIKDALGKSVKVIKVWDDGDLQVTYGSKKWTLNQDCLKERACLQAGADLNIGDFKSVIEDKEEIKLLQNGHGGWSNLMNDIAGKKVEIVHILEDGDCYVRYNQMDWMMNPKCFVEKKEIEAPPVNFKVGDLVEIDKDIEKVKRLQNGHGGWVSIMSKVCGKRGKIDMVLPTSDLRIKVNQLVFVFNRKCVKLVEKAKLEVDDDVEFKPGDKVKIIGDIKKAKELQKGHGEWTTGMELFLNETGKVKFLFPDGDLRVKVMGTQLTLNPKCCKKVANDDSDEEVPDFLKMLSQMQRLFGGIGVDDDDDDDDDNSNTDKNIGGLMPDMSEKMEFIKAIKEGDGTKVERLIGFVERDEKFNDFTAAHIAVSEGHDHIIRILTNNQYKFDIGDKDGDTALHIAVIKNRNNCVLAILESGTDPNQKNEAGMTPLMLAVTAGYKDILQSLLNSTKTKINFRSEKCGTALHVAIKKGRSEEAVMLIDSGADLTAENENQFPALHLAALVGSERILENILDKGPPALIDSQKEDGFAAVHVCAINNHLSCMQLLIDKNADLNIRTSKKQTALHLAVSQKYLDMVKLLVINKADPNLKDEEGDTPLHDAIKAYSVERLRNAADIFGFSRLLDVSKGPGKLDEIAVYLAQNGARLDIKNSNGKTPIDVCTSMTLQSKLIEILNPTESVTVRTALSPTRNDDRRKEASKTINIEKENIDDDIKDKLEQYEDERNCKICYAKKADMAFGCGHMCCHTCAPNILDCHICRKNIETRIKLYNS